MINRDGKYLTPNGNTVLQPNDKLMVLAETRESLSEALEQVCTLPMED
jgi:cell volume regulation protein A